MKGGTYSRLVEMQHVLRQARAKLETIEIEADLDVCRELKGAKILIDETLNRCANAELAAREALSRETAA
jgi:hypothetical protein